MAVQPDEPLVITGPVIIYTVRQILLGESYQGEYDERTMKCVHSFGWKDLKEEATRKV
jgi:hypothetical protein